MTLTAISISTQLEVSYHRRKSSNDALDDKAVARVCVCLLCPFGSFNVLVEIQRCKVRSTECIIMRFVKVKGITRLYLWSRFLHIFYARSQVFNLT